MSVSAGYLSASEQPLSSLHDVLLLDLDGTTYLGAVAAPNAPQALAEAKKAGARTMYLTNNSGRSPQVVADHLSSIGIATAPSEVLNSSQVAARTAEKLLPSGAKVLLIGGEGLRAAFAQTSFCIVTCADDKPQAVVQGLSESVGWAELSEAALAISKYGAMHIATNLDATLPRERGEMIGNGSLVACISNATGTTPINCGKPEPAMFSIGSEIAQARKPLAVGDRLNTDIAGAVAAGIPCFHVLTGVCDARAIMTAEPSWRPSYLGIDLLDLNSPQPAVTRKENEIPLASAQYSTGSWVCGAWSAQVADGYISICRNECAPAHSQTAEHISSEMTISSLTSSAAEHTTHILSEIMIPLDSAHKQHGEHVQEGVRDEKNSLPLDAYRAAVCAMWEAADRTIIDPSGLQLPEIEIVRAEAFMRDVLNADSADSAVGADNADGNCYE